MEFSLLSVTCRSSTLIPFLCAMKIKGENILKIHLCCCNAILQIDICILFWKCYVIPLSTSLHNPKSGRSSVQKACVCCSITWRIVSHFYPTYIIICFHCLNLNFKGTFFRHLHEVSFSITNLIVIPLSAFWHIIHYILL